MHKLKTLKPLWLTLTYWRSGIDYAMLSTINTRYQTAKGTILYSLKVWNWYDNSNMHKLTKRAICYVRLDGPTLIIEKDPL